MIQVFEQSEQAMIIRPRKGRSFDPINARILIRAASFYILGGPYPNIQTLFISQDIQHIGHRRIVFQRHKMYER
jgi:hypothetical protein